MLMEHNGTARKAVVLMNLGSPDSTSVADVRRYLDEFLMDERVIDIPAFIRRILVKGIIVPFRAPKSAKAYRSIWWEDGSPLIVITKRLQVALQAQMPDTPVEIAMRYGTPSPKVAFDKLVAQNPDLEEVVAVPLYPHYAMSSYETAAEYAKVVHAREGYKFKLKIVPPFYNDPQYIHALVESIRPYLNEPFDHLLFSYHGVPERHIRKGDPTGKHCLTNGGACCDTPSEAHAVCYRHQDIMTTMLTAQALGLPKEKFSFAFQSRLGQDKWLRPYTANRLEELPKKEGVKRLLVVCPAFVSDCLETIEEIGEEGAESFLESGGESFKLIPCLNDNPLWVDTLKTLIEREMTADVVA